MKYCNKCGDDVPAKRHRLGYRTCHACGESDARARKRTIAPLSKSNYYYFTEESVRDGDLARLNPKRV